MGLLCPFIFSVLRVEMTGAFSGFTITGPLPPRYHRRFSQELVRRTVLDTAAPERRRVVQYIDMRPFACMVLLPLVCAAVPKPADWVPVRWPWTDVPSLELLAGSPVNCLLLKDSPAEFV